MTKKFNSLIGVECSFRELCNNDTYAIIAILYVESQLWVFKILLLVLNTSIECYSL